MLYHHMNVLVKMNLRPDFFYFMFHGRKLPGCIVDIRNKKKVKIHRYLENADCLEGWIRQM